MKILKKYVFKEFIKFFFITTFSFMSIFLLVEFVEKVDDLLEHGVPLSTSVLYFLYKLPFIFALISPVAVLLSVLISLGLLSKHSELTAIKAGGISVLRVVGPIFLFGLFLSGAVIYINESFVPFTNKRVAQIETKWLKKKQSGIFGAGGLWLKSQDGIYNIKKLNADGEGLEGITLYKVDRDFNVSGKMYAESARWDGSAWVAPLATQTAFAGGPDRESEIKNLHLPGLSPPEEITTPERTHENMSFTELNDYIKGLEKEGYNASRYTVDLYGKISFPLVNVIMVLVGIPFALRGGRRAGIADGIAISVAIAFSFWIIFAIMRSLGQSGVLPPLVAAAFPDLLFLAIGTLMFSYVRQ